MKIIQLINQNIPIWAVIKGDHSCTDIDHYLSSELIEKPNFMDSKANRLRRDYLRHTTGRNWVADYLEDKSFALVELEKEDIEKVLTVWEDTNLFEITKKYKAAHRRGTGFRYQSVYKPKRAIKEVFERQKFIPSTFDQDWLTTFDKRYDYHRAIWIKNRNGTYQIIDGTHRTIATTWKYLLDLKRMPKWYAIMSER
jgi:hypothetical protein